MLKDSWEHGPLFARIIGFFMLDLPLWGRSGGMLEFFAKLRKKDNLWLLPPKYDLR